VNTSAENTAEQYAAFEKELDRMYSDCRAEYSEHDCAQLMTRQTLLQGILPRALEMYAEAEEMLNMARGKKATSATAKGMTATVFREWIAGETHTEQKFVTKAKGVCSAVRDLLMSTESQLRFATEEWKQSNRGQG